MRYNSSRDESHDYTWFNRSDIAIFGANYYIWINGTQPVTVNLRETIPSATPNSPFPFTRLASVAFLLTTYLYHQINGTSFAEEQWDDSESTWRTTEYINVSELSVQEVS